jgi:hypothetical protein
MDIYTPILFHFTQQSDKSFVCNYYLVSSLTKQVSDAQLFGTVAAGIQ